MAVGEKLSCRIVAGLLEDRGVETEFVNLENVIEAVFDVNSLDQNFYDYLSRAFAAAVSKCGNRVPVVTGKWKWIERGEAGKKKKVQPRFLRSRRIALVRLTLTMV